MKTQLNEILRLLRIVIRTGIVTDIDLDGGLCRVRTGGMQTTWLNWLTCRASRSRVWWAPSVGEQVLLLAMSGNKIDVTATEKAQEPLSIEQAGESIQWAHRTIEMSWGDAWKRVIANDKKTPPPKTDAQIQDLVLRAVEETGLDVEFLDDGGICVFDCESEHIFRESGIFENAWLVIRFIRFEFCYNASLHRDEVDSWSPEGLAALAEWAPSEFKAED